ncbi:MAG: DUF1731 domain-containing protein, partial [Proteobacteria bacterium]|nr:DUF1731 domain-containing protein [Pseudomonadota bacterium]
CINAKRTVVLRLGLVLGENGGALARMRPIFAGGLGGRLGSGQQIMSWIHRDDLIRIISQALQVESWQGTYNCVAPGWVSNKRFTLCLAKTLGVPALLPVPSIVLRLLLGERSEILLKGQKVRPQRLLQQGFVFRYPQLPEAMLELCSVQASPSGEKACERLESVQFIERPLSEVFQFFCTPHNLERRNYMGSP